MPVDTAPVAVTAAVPVLSSGREAIAVARELAVLGTRSQRHRLFGDVLAGARLGNYLLNGALPPNHGQI